MKWKDLKLSKQSLHALREDYGIEEPEQVIKLAWGAPSLLERVISDKEIKYLRETFSSPDGGKYDSSGFAMGAQFGSPLESLVGGDEEFEVKRSNLLEQLEREHSPLRRAAIESDLQKLYERE